MIQYSETRDISRFEQLDAILYLLVHMNELWRDAGFPTEGPNWEARQGVLVLLAAFNKRFDDIPWHEPDL